MMTFLVYNAVCGITFNAFNESFLEEIRPLWRKGNSVHDCGNNANTCLFNDPGIGH